MLDAAEYLHLALNASQKGDSHAALNYLKEVLALEPRNAPAQYLLAAEHAELGLYDRAIAGMETALELDPSLDTARFQLGLLYLQSSRKDDARLAFSELQARTLDTALGYCAQAYLAMLDEDAARAIPLLRQGIEACSANPALRGDMERVLASLDDTASAPTPASGAETAASTAGTVFLGAYRNNEEH